MRLKKAQPATDVSAIASIPIVSILKIQLILWVAKVAALGYCGKDATELYNRLLKVAL